MPKIFWQISYTFNDIITDVKRDSKQAEKSAMTKIIMVTMNDAESLYH